MFSLTEDQKTKIEEWLMKEVYPPIIEEQKKQHAGETIYEIFWDNGVPYSGMIGGNLTYCFTPTSVGLIVKVKESHSDKELDLTEYDHW